MRLARFYSMRSVVVVLAIAQLLSSGLQAQGKGVRLEYGSKVGDTSVYHLTMDGNTTVFVGDRTQKTQIRTEMYLTQKVEAFKEGVIDLMTKIDSGSINVNNQTSVLPNVGQTVKTSLKKNGEIVNSSGFGPNINLNQMQLVFPDQALEVGSSWKSTMEPSPAVPVTLEVEYKVLGFEKIRDFECIKLASSVRSGPKSTIEGLQLKVQADGNIYYAHKEGKMVKNDVKSTMEMILKRVIDNQPQSIITRMGMDMQMELQY
ncbi:MAG: hypothetical protein HY816_11685 [Candidatus Wallbacteria bacterium]|nr:hypothetical protein [Candidatus Wallbacteria bacterium]